MMVGRRQGAAGPAAPADEGQAQPWQQRGAHLCEGLPQDPGKRSVRQVVHAAVRDTCGADCSTVLLDCCPRYNGGGGSHGRLLWLSFSDRHT